MKPAAVRIILHRRGGAFGPFRIKVPCGERALTRDLIEDRLADERAETSLALETHDWFSLVGPSTPITTSPSRTGGASP